MYSRTIMMGRLVADPKLCKTASDISVARFSIAVDRTYKINDKRPTDFFDCIAWRQLGETVAKHFHKGKPILVEGHFENRNYEKDGVKRWVTELIVESFTFTGDSTGKEQNNLPEPPPDPHDGQAPAYTSNSSADFAEVGGGSDDLPF